MEPPIVQYEESKKIALVRMDDGKANALSHAMLEQLEAAMTRAEGEAKAVVIEGRPGRFCAGFDLKTMMSGPDAARALVRRGGELLLRLYTFPLPVVLACTGHAMAGGALFLLVGDLRIGAVGDFKIGLNEIAIGMPLPILAMEFARDRLCPRHLSAATLQATIYSPDQAIGVGYLDRVVSAEAVRQQSIDAAIRLAALDRRAYAMSKSKLREATIRHIRDTIAEDMDRLTGPID